MAFEISRNGGTRTTPRQPGRALPKNHNWLRLADPLPGPQPQPAPEKSGSLDLIPIFMKALQPFPEACRAIVEALRKTIPPVAGLVPQLETGGG